MFGTGSRASRLTVRGPQSRLVVFLLSLAMLLPALPVQLAAAEPDAAPATSLRAQQPDQTLIAFLRDGNVWVANADGTDEQQLTTDGEAEVTMFGFPPQGGEPGRVFYSGFSWSPDGQYLAITKDGPSRTREVLLFDAESGELSTLVTGIYKTAYLPAWATDANELLVPKGTAENSSSGRRELLRIVPDGTASEAPSFESGRPVCGLPSGPGILPPDALMLRETLVLRDMVDPSFQWSASEKRVLINRWCWAPQWLDLANGAQTPVLLPGEDSGGEERGPGSLLLRPGDSSQGVTVGTPLFTTAGDLHIYDMDSANLTTVASGSLGVWHPDGERILFSRSTTIAEYEVTSSSYPWTIRENSTALFEVQRDGTAKRPIAELPVYGVGWPSISHDGNWLIMSAVENPTEAIANIPAGGQVTDEWLQSYPPPVNLHRVDIETGQTDLVLENAGWPKIQPEGTPPVSEDEPTDLTGTPEQHAQKPETVEYPFSVPIVPYVCEQRPDPQSIAPGTTELPEGCTLAAGATFTVTGTDGVVYGSCTTPPGGGLCGVGAPAETDLLVTMDESTLPAGYRPVENPVPAWLRNVANDADGAQFIILPVDIASAQAGIPVEEPAPDVAGAAGVQIEPGSGWIAYVGDDGNIWLMQPDGSQQTQITTDGSNEHGVPSYSMPAWSPDGTVLVFHKAGEGIMVYRGGTLTPVPDTARCGPAAITLDNSRLLYSCASGGAPYEPDPNADQISTDPQLAAIASSNLDGTDARVLVSYTLSNAGQNAIPWVDSGLVGFNRLGNIAVNSATGEILGTFGLLHSATAWLVEPGGAPNLTEIPFSDANQDLLGPFVAEFLPGSEQVVALVCEQGCYPDYQDQVRSIVILNRDGSVSQRLIGSDTVPGLVDVTVSPDATGLVFATYSTGGDASSMLWSMPIGEGATPLQPGSSPAWQPNPDVVPAGGAVEQPSGVTSPSGSTAPPATSGQPPPAQAAPGAVPNQFIATWSGRGVQENPYGEWAVTISITGGGVGEIVGTSEYPEEVCGGNLILQEVTAGSIVLREQLTYGQETCADGGSITLSGIDGRGCQFAWRGIGPYGTPSSASGTLYRPDSGAESQTAAQSGVEPTVDATQLHTFFIRTWAGTGDQLNPTNQWPITVTFTGGRPGEVVGTSEYPTLGCGGELILDSIDPYDNFLTINVTERITYGQENCTDIGTFVFSGAEGATRLHFSYGGASVATTAEGWLDPVAASAPADQASDGGSVVEPAGGEAPGGPPSIYDDPEAEPVPIEAEGG